MQSTQYEQLSAYDQTSPSLYKTQRSTFSEDLGPVTNGIHPATNNEKLTADETSQSPVQISFASRADPATDFHCACGEDSPDGLSRFFPVAKIINEAIGVGSDLFEGVHEFVHDVVHDGAVQFVPRCLLSQCCVEEDPDNNIHIPNPLFGGTMVGLGMNIHKDNRGHLIKAVTSGGLAEKAKLMKNDIITCVNDRNICNMTFEELQTYFGNLKSLQINLEIKRHIGIDDGGEPIFKTLSITIILTRIDDKVVVDIEIKVGWSSLQYDTSKPPDSLPEYYIYIQDENTSRYMYMNGTEVAMTTNVQPDCKFKLYPYQPYFESPRVLFNVSCNRPVDLGKTNRVGVNSEDLTNGKKLDVNSDRRFFSVQKVSSSAAVQVTFKLASSPKMYLFMDNDSKLGLREYNNLSKMGSNAQFYLVQADKLTQSSVQNSKV